MKKNEPLKITAIESKTIASQNKMSEQAKKEYIKRSRYVVGVLHDGGGYDGIGDSYLELRSDLGVAGAPSQVFKIPFDVTVQIPQGLVDEIKDMKIPIRKTKKINPMEYGIDGSMGDEAYILEDRIVVVGEKRCCTFNELVPVAMAG